MQIKILYQISERHWRVWYNNKEVDMQVINIEKFKCPIQLKRVLIEYNYNGINHMLVELE